MTEARTGGVPASSPLALYALLAFAMLSLMGAALGIYGGLNKLALASFDVEKSYRRIAAAEHILALARDAETGQRGFLLTGQSQFLAPYEAAERTAPFAWRSFVDVAPLHHMPDVLAMRRTFDQLSRYNAEAIALRRTQGTPTTELTEKVTAGKAKMDELRTQVQHFVRHEQDHLRNLRREDDIAYNDAIVQTLIGSFALILAGALLYAAMREARRDAGKNAALAEAADQRFKATFEQASIGILHLSPSGGPMIVNDAMCAMTGFSRNEILQAEPGSPAYIATRSQVPDLDNAIAKGVAHQIYTVQSITRKDGAQIWIGSLLSAVRSADGEIAFWSIMIRDISDQRAAEQQLQESQDRLRRLQDEMAHIGRVNDLGEMAAAIAHEINQPLTAINNYMSVAQRMAQSAPKAIKDLPQVLARAGEQAVRAGQIIRRMRSFIERREHVRTPEAVGDLIESSIELALLGADRTLVNITYQRTADDVRLLVDPVQVQQILLILLRNAMEAFIRAQQEGRAEIQIFTDVAISEAGHIAIHVRDNGPGLSPDILAQLFQPFITTKPGNLGMGLPIARRLAEQHGGRLDMLPSETGAHFVIYLPLPNQSLAKMH
ncbi:MAG: CHASE3 domain-containing protein [Alphaproteobacteria bacterium]|nr:CHASE3 domain-containing protein [Alphaproteobacteria bacterium]